MNMLTHLLTCGFNDGFSEELFRDVHHLQAGPKQYVLHQVSKGFNLARDIYMGIQPEFWQKKSSQMHTL